MLIGICGQAGSGKDTAADFLVSNHGFTKVSFADPLKRICRDVYRFTNEQLWGPSEMRNVPDSRYPREHTWGSDPKAGLYTCVCCGGSCQRGGGPTPLTCYLTPRYALQMLGTEWGRHCYPHTWLDAAVSVYEALQAGGCRYDRLEGLRNTRAGDPGSRDVVIADVRFRNEVEALQARGARVIRLIREEGGLGAASAAHVSESGQGGIPDTLFDSVILNNRSISDLEKAIKWAVEEWSTP